jgi:hypothetical protein
MPQTKARQRMRLEIRNTARCFDSIVLTSEFYHSRPQAARSLYQRCLSALIFSPVAVLKAGN